MSSRRIRAVLVVLGLSVVRPVAAGGGFFVLVNQSNAVTSISRSDIKRAVTGGIKQWESGAVVKLGIIPNDAAETQYLASLLNMTPRELMARIQEEVFKGELRRPALLRSSGDCVEFARSNAGAICVAVDSVPVPPEAHVVIVP